MKVLYHLGLIKLLPTQNFVSVIANDVTWLAAAPDYIAKFADQVRMRSISKLINDIPRVIKKLLGYFNDTIFACIMHYTFFPPSLPVWLVVFSLRLGFFRLVKNPPLPFQE